MDTQGSVTDRAELAPEVVVVGLGPAGRRLLTRAADDALTNTRPRFARTARHPAIADLGDEGIDFDCLDAAYDSADSLEAAYLGIVDRLVEAATEAGRILYAVPGSPSVAEVTVRMLEARENISVSVIEGMSFVEPALGAVGADVGAEPVAIIDGRRIGEQLPGLVCGSVPPALLISQIDSAVVLGEVKLALLEAYEPEHGVALLHGLATPEQEVRRVGLAELDHGQRDPGPLACAWVPRPAAPEYPFDISVGHARAGRGFASLVALQDRLRSPGGCPWDAEQTHRSLATHLLEEAYEVLDVLDRFPEAPASAASDADYHLLAEELGDLVMQVVFHARLAEEADAFDAASVLDGIVAKLIARHPHVFAQEEAASAEAVVSRWEAGKRREKGRASAIDDIPVGLPSLARASKLVSRTRAAGLDWGTREGAVARLESALRVLSRPDESANGADVGIDAALADVLFAVAVFAKLSGRDPETTLRSRLALWEDGFSQLEHHAKRETVDGESAWDLPGSS